MIRSDPVNVVSRPDPRIARSEAAIQDALLAQMNAGRDLASLTVSEIAEQAGVTRKTFYARFGTLEQVAERILFELFGDIAAQIDDEMLMMPMRDRSTSLLVFRACAAQRDVLTPMVRHCPAGLLEAPMGMVVAQLLERAIAVNRLEQMSDAQRNYFVATVSSMVRSVLSVWVAREFRETPEQVAGFLDTLISGGMQNLLLHHTP